MRVSTGNGRISSSVLAPINKLNCKSAFKCKMGGGREGTMQINYGREFSQVVWYDKGLFDVADNHISITVWWSRHQHHWKQENTLLHLLRQVPEAKAAVCVAANAGMNSREGFPVIYGWWGEKDAGNILFA